MSLLSLLGLQPDQAPMQASSMGATSMAQGQTMQQPKGLLGLGGNLGGFLDFQDPQRLIGLQFLANGQKAPGEMLDGIPQLALYGSKLQQQKLEQQKEQQQTNKTLEWLRANRPDLVPMAEAGLVKEAFAQAYKKKEPNILGAGAGRLYNADTGEWIVAPGVNAAEQPKYGLSPQYGVDKNGNPVLLQISDTGVATQTRLPDGVSFSKEPIKLDTGTGYTLLDPITRQPVGTVPKDIAGAAAAQVEGKTTAEQRMAAPGDLQNAQNALDLISSIRNDPNRQRGTGKTSIFNAIPGTAGFDFQQKVEQAKGGAFLTAIQQLKGLGALSNAEGDGATRAVTRLTTASTEEGFLEALDDYEKIVRQGYDRAKSKMPQSTQPQMPQQPAQSQVRKRFNPATGELE